MSDIGDAVEHFQTLNHGHHSKFMEDITDSFHLARDFGRNPIGSAAAFLPPIAIGFDLVNNVQNVFSSDTSTSTKIISAVKGIAEGVALAGILL